MKEVNFNTLENIEIYHTINVGNNWHSNYDSITHDINASMAKSIRLSK